MQYLILLCTPYVLTNLPAYLLLDRQELERRRSSLGRMESLTARVSVASRVAGFSTPRPGKLQHDITRRGNSHALHANTVDTANAAAGSVAEPSQQTLSFALLPGWLCGFSDAYAAGYVAAGYATAAAAPAPLSSVAPTTTDERAEGHERLPKPSSADADRRRSAGSFNTVWCSINGSWGTADEAAVATAAVAEAAAAEAAAATAAEEAATAAAMAMAAVGAAATATAGAAAAATAMAAATAAAAAAAAGVAAGVAVSEYKVNGRGASLVALASSAAALAAGDPLRAADLAIELSRVARVCPASSAAASGVGTGTAAGAGAAAAAAGASAAIASRHAIELWLLPPDSLSDGSRSSSTAKHGSPSDLPFQAPIFRAGCRDGIEVAVWLGAGPRQVYRPQCCGQATP